MADDERGVRSQTKTSSKQLLYAENFEGTLLERKLQIVGKKRAGLSKPCLPPPSPVLRRVEAFLPKLRAANEQLKNKPQQDVDIETLSPEYDGPVIEMNLTLMPDLGTSDSSSSEDEEESDDDDDDASEDKEESDDDDDEKNDNSSEGGPSISELLAPSKAERKGRKRTLVEVLETAEDRDDTEEKTKCAKRMSGENVDSAMCV